MEISKILRQEKRFVGKTNCVFLEQVRKFLNWTKLRNLRNRDIPPVAVQKFITKFGAGLAGSSECLRNKANPFQDLLHSPEKASCAAAIGKKP